MPKTQTQDAELLPPTQAVAVRQPSSLATRMPSINIESLIEKAVDSKAAVEVVKELRAMFLDDQKRAAESAFNEAMSAFQEGCPTIIKSKGVSTNSGALAYKYAPIEEIEAVIRPVERQHGFNHTFTQDVESQPGWVIARCIVTHINGHSRETVGKFPIGTKTQIMSDTQVYASALTFCNRRVLANAYGLVIAGEDKDGAGKPKPTATARVVTPDIRTRFFEVTKDIKDKMHQWAIDKGHVMPDAGLDTLPDAVIPTTKGGLEKLRAEIEAHK